MKFRKKYLYILIIIFSLSCCSKSKLLNIQDKKFSFNEQSFEKSYSVNDVLNSFNIEIIIPEGISINALPNGSLLVVIENQDGENEENILNKGKIEQYYYSSYEERTISRIVYKTVDLGKYKKIKKIKVLVKEPFCLPESAILNITNLSSALFFESN